MLIKKASFRVKNLLFLYISYKIDQFDMVAPPGIEPGTHRASICCSTDWAKKPIMAV